MEYGRRQPIKGESGQEPTALTMKSIKELLAEELANVSEAPTLRTPLPQSHLQQPPHMRTAPPVEVVKEPVTKKALRTSAAPKVAAEMTAPPMPLPKAAQEMHAAAEAEVAPAPKPRSFLGRLIGG